MLPVAGVDGCRSGWVVATGNGAFVAPDFAAVVAALPSDTVIAVDIPIGLLEAYVPGGREADRAARRALGARRSSVFSAPTRRALGARTLEDARAQGCPMTIQALNILAKIRDVDAVMTPHLQRRVREVFPELCFQAMNRDQPLPSKKHRDGRAARRALLQATGIAVPDRLVGAAEDDLLDAGAALWGGRRIAARIAERVPEVPPVDRRGLRMEICW